MNQTLVVFMVGEANFHGLEINRLSHLTGLGLLI
jgi:hypothetical protein